MHEIKACKYFLFYYGKMLCLIWLLIRVVQQNCLPTNYNVTRQERKHCMVGLYYFVLCGHKSVPNYWLSQCLNDNFIRQNLPTNTMYLSYYKKYITVWNIHFVCFSGRHFEKCSPDSYTGGGGEGKGMPFYVRFVWFAKRCDHLKN